MGLKLDGTRVSRGAFSLSADFALDDPGLTAVIGPSGGGKSTLLALIAGFVRPEEGRIRWNGTELTDLAPGNRPVAMLFQDNNLFPHLDILTNVALGAAPVARPDTVTMERASQALEQVGLAGLQLRKPSELSGGQQSRAALARVLVTDRPIVLMDEPFAALGPAQRREMLTLVKTLLPAKTLLMVTHHEADAREASRTIFVRDGRVDPPKETDELFAQLPAELENYLR